MEKHKLTGQSLFEIKLKMEAAYSASQDTLKKNNIMYGDVLNKALKFFLTVKDYDEEPFANGDSVLSFLSEEEGDLYTELCEKYSMYVKLEEKYFKEQEEYQALQEKYELTKKGDNNVN